MKDLNLEINMLDMIDELPHGSGIDCDWSYEVKPTSKTVHFSNAYHCMDEHGSYDRYADFTLIVSLEAFNFKVQFNGNTSQKLNYKYGLREYLEDTLAWALNDSDAYGEVLSA